MATNPKKPNVYAGLSVYTGCSQVVYRLQTWIHIHVEPGCGYQGKI